MAAVVKWKAQLRRCYSLLAVAICILLVVAASQLPSTRQDRRKFLEQKSSQEQGDNGRGWGFFNNRAPFIHEHDFKGKMSSLSSRGGVLGPLLLLASSEELESLPRIARHWDELRIEMRPRLEMDGFLGPSERSCFLWIDACRQLGLHPGILKAVRGILGDPVVLYGLSMWTASPQSEQALDFGLEGYNCDTVNVLLNSGVRYVKSSDSLTVGAALAVLKQIQAQARLHSNLSQAALNHRIERIAVSHLGRFVKSGTTLVRLNAQPGDGFLIHGKTLYSASNPSNSPRTSALLQFASGSCKFRDVQPNPNFNGLTPQSLVPPTLLVPSNGSVVQEGGFQRDLEPVAVAVNDTPAFNGSVLEGLPGSRVTLFRKRRLNATTGGTLLRQVLGISRSSLLDRIIIETVVLLSYHMNTTTLPLEFMTYSENQILVVFSKWVKHHYATKVTTDSSRATYSEVVDLGVGDVSFMRKGVMHALELPPGTEVMLVKWRSSNSLDPNVGNVRRKMIIKGKRLFEMPAGDLGAINAETVILKSGQAYDPDNEADCDVVVVVLKGTSLQVVPFRQFLDYNEAVLIPAGESCILWNAGVVPITIVAIQLYKALNKPIVNDKDAYFVEASYRSRGKVM